jgi:glycine/D-amino acid oxidase-like deaminating enzyme
LIERPYWWDTVPPGSDGQSSFETERDRSGRQSLPSSVDVLVVGAGYTGLSAARRLALSGASVLVVDSNGVGWGASSRNGGQVLTGLRLDAASLVAEYGEGRARGLFDAAGLAIANLESLIADEGVECGFERVGHVQAAWKPSHFRAFEDEQALLARVFEHPVRLVERSRQRSEIGSDAYHGLLVDEGSAALNPAQYVTGLAAAARRRGACIVPHARVDRLERSGSGWTVDASAGTVAARDVLVATNGYTSRATPEIQRRLVPVGSYIIATEPLPEALASTLLPTRRMAFDSKHFLYYFRVTSDRRLLFGGRAEFTPPNAQSIRRAAAILRGGMARVFPEMASVGIDYVWGGNVAFTRDELPHAGRIDGLYFAGGYAGHGIALATELGDLIARRMGGAAVDNPLLDVECPTIPFYSGTPWFLPLAGAYYKVMDWIS